MLSKKQKMMRLNSLEATTRLKDILMKDFSESVSSLIINHNYYKHGLKLNSLNNADKTKVVNAIVSDYKAIKPIGSVAVVQLKKGLRLAIK